MSAKPSDTSTSPRDLPPVLLLDENLSSEDIAQFLRLIPHVWQIELHSDYFPRGMSDVDVIRECAGRGWVLISCDDRIRYVPQNKAAAIKHCLRVFMFGKGNYQGVEYAAALVVGRGHLIRIVRNTAGPFFARIQIHGDVNMLEPKESKTELTSREKTALKYGADVHRVKE